IVCGCPRRLRGPEIYEMRNHRRADPVMLKSQILWRLGLLVGLILGASMVVTATASAAPFYTSCAETTGKESPYGNTACTEQESGPGGSYVHAYYSYLGTFLCLF